MRIYLEITKFNLLKYLSYPWEILAFFVSNLISFGLLILFWKIFSQNSIQPVNFRSIIAYFLISTAINNLTFVQGLKFGGKIIKTIKRGDLNNFLLKPVRLLPNLFVNLFVGNYGLYIILSVIYFTIGLTINPPKNIINILLFVLSYIAAIILSLSFNILVACFQFYTREAKSVKNVFNHIVRLLSGAFVPLYFFPDYLEKIVLYLPFGGVVYGPVKALQTESIGFNDWKLLLTSFAWGVVLLFLVLKLWDKSIKKYEATGI